MTTAAAATEHPKESIKETLISIIIAFVLAFVFRGFVIEAFVIPTGSMAPTLMGQHMRFTGPRTGYQWAVGPWYFPNPADTQNPAPIQGKPNPSIVVHDPMTGDRLVEDAVRTRSGDRILVLKYLYAVREPQRFDVVVFKNPENPADNYIKRLIGLAGEQIALVDGDVFYRRPDAGEAAPSPDPVQAAALWARTDWRIARKTPDAARALWLCIFDSAFTPTASAGAEFERAFVAPWVGETPAAPSLASRDWQIAGRRSYAFRGNAGGVLRWNSSGTFFADSAPAFPRSNWPIAQSWSIDDRYPYDEAQTTQFRPNFPVSDLRLRAGFEPASSQSVDVTGIIKARGQEFRARITQGQAFLEMRAAAPAAGADDGPWQPLAQGPAAIAPGRITDVEFWHLDQSLQLWVDGRLIARGEYNWSPAERIAAATGKPLVRLVDPNDSTLRNGIGLTLPSNYRAPSVEWRVSAPVTMHRVALDRDLHYRPDSRGSVPAWATNPATTMTLSPNEFFVCGDNSPQSKDGRLWSEPEAWVSALIDDTPGVVPRRLMLGKAFFVYFPALAGSNPIPVPDFGRLRFIR
ncbi:MAG: signal peptidase I [Phycisphaerales bacterium]